MTEHPALTLFCAVALRGAVEHALLPAFTRDTGIAVEARFAPTSALVQEIDAGARPDVVLGITAALERFAAAGILDAGSLTPLAQAGIGVAVPPGAAVPDISTVEALTAALTAARSVAYSRNGPSGIYFAKLLQELGIAGQVTEQATVVDTGFTALALLDGRADLAIQQMSELLSVPEAEIAGPLPAEIQHYTAFSAGTAPGTGRHDAGALVAYLAGEPAKAAYAAAGLEPAG
ncbi:molybdate ABC transporter substrate-binding protein [Pseudarthrobacter sp. H2]|uniref:molybdate ABC transporter substrate-binding protein n=1 Tax=Pseudarthrobacter sp. H2 TaxID=3418415 RepID=UPI003CFB982D